MMSSGIRLSSTQMGLRAPNILLRLSKKEQILASSMDETSYVGVRTYPGSEALISHHRRIRTS